MCAEINMLLTQTTYCSLSHVVCGYPVVSKCMFNTLI